MDADLEAKELIDIFFKEVLHYEVEYGYVLAKQCALICCDKIMNEILPKGARNGKERQKEIFWQSVKKSIINQP